MGEKVNPELKIKMFGRFDITYKGKSIFLEIGGSAKAVAMLRFLLAQKEKVFTAEAVAQNVWPENEYVDEGRVIRTYIHRLRKILNQENVFKKDFTSDINIKNLKGGYKAEVSDNVEIDTVAFEQYKSIIMDNQEPVLDAFMKIIKIYSGEFLEECRYDHWVIMLRNYYLRTFTSITCHVLSILQNEKNCQAILDVCEKSLKICELDENINIYFLNALIDTDQISSALQHYSFITSKMYTELSVTPSEKLREIYSKIKAYKKQEDSVGTLTTEIIDRKSLFNMLDDIVKTYLEGDKNKYSVAYMNVVSINELGEVVPDRDINACSAEEKADINNNLIYAMYFALRKNDMYYINEENCTAIAVLYDAKEDFYDNIKSRISDAFYSKCTEFKYKINIGISRLTVVD